VNGLQPWDQSDRQEQTKVEDKIFQKGRGNSLYIWQRIWALARGHTRVGSGIEPAISSRKS